MPEQPPSGFIPRPAWSRGETLLTSAIGGDPLPMLSREWAWGGAEGAGVRVAIVDSGIEAAHPGLDGCVDEEAGVILRLSDSGEVIEESGPHEDVFGHGTACAGIVHGIAPLASLTSVRVLGPDLTGRGKVFLYALNWAIEKGYDVINLSLSTSKREYALPFYELCDRAYFENCFVVASANNMPIRSFPAMCSGVASVACHRLTDSFEFYSNPEPPPEFLAPGMHVEVLGRGGTTVRTTGNSMATAHMSGIAALVRSKHPLLRPYELKAALGATAARPEHQTAQASLEGS